MAIIRANGLGRIGRLGALGSTFPTSFAKKSTVTFSAPTRSPAARPGFRASPPAPAVQSTSSALTAAPAGLNLVGRPPPGGSPYLTAVANGTAPAVTSSSMPPATSPTGGFVGNILNSFLNALPGAQGNKFGQGSQGSSNFRKLGISPTLLTAARLQNPLTYQPQTAAALAVQQAVAAGQGGASIIPLFPPPPGAPPLATQPYYPSGGDDSGGGGGGGGYGGDAGPANDDNYGDQSDLPDYGGDDGSDNSDDADGGPTTSNSGGYAEQGGGGPADTYASDTQAIIDTEQYQPQDIESRQQPRFVDPGYQDSSYADGAGYDNDDDEDSGGQDMYNMAPSSADVAPVDSWNWRDRRQPQIPEHMYMSHRHRPGGEEGDDDMDASDYVAALQGYDAPGMGGFTDFLKTLGKDVGVTALNASATALGSKTAGKTVTVPPAPPMSTAAKVGIGIAVAIPVLYFVAKSMKGSAPAVATNPRRRRRRR